VSRDFERSRCHRAGAPGQATHARIAPQLPLQARISRAAAEPAPCLTHRDPSLRTFAVDPPDLDRQRATLRRRRLPHSRRRTVSAPRPPMPRRRDIAATGGRSQARMRVFGLGLSLPRDTPLIRFTTQPMRQSPPPRHAAWGSSTRLGRHRVFNDHVVDRRRRLRPLRECDPGCFCGLIRRDDCLHRYLMYLVLAGSTRRSVTGIVARDSHRLNAHRAAAGRRGRRRRVLRARPLAAPGAILPVRLASSAISRTSGRWANVGLLPDSELRGERLCAAAANRPRPWVREVALDLEPARRSTAFLGSRAHLCSKAHRDAGGAVACGAGFSCLCGGRHGVDDHRGGAAIGRERPRDR
jgi:hypothetical protein